ncbi:MAG: FAD:protein FMN transferase [Pirellulales bacterium]|nr:FAD:protein FMN transferase [Pirellulales bacterium]
MKIAIRVMTKTGWFILGISVLCLLVGIGLWQTRGTHIAIVRRPQGIMGTSCTLVAVVPWYQRASALESLQDAEARIRNIEARLSNWIDASEISRFNGAEANEKIQLSAEAWNVLSVARQVYKETDGVFDITCRPLIELWREAGKRGKLPTDAEIHAARSSSNWQAIQQIGTCAVKQLATAKVDLGGIAKGYAVDEAVEVLQKANIQDGLVEIGGDERFFGHDGQGNPWSTAVKNPFGDGILMELPAGEAAVCTSGHYARFQEIEGRRYSHILDPRTGLPATGVASVTVKAPTAIMADIWATTLSVLGPDGMDKVPDGVEALMITDESDDVHVLATPGIQEHAPSSESVRNLMPKRAGSLQMDLFDFR